MEEGATWRQKPSIATGSSGEVDAPISICKTILKIFKIIYIKAVCGLLN